jgi:RNA-splicing ligase RtcB
MSQISVRGKYNEAIIYTENVEEGAIAQLIELCNQEFTKGCKIRVMPDTHQGTGCVIGFTAELGDKVIPNLVGVDISCGMFVVELGKVNNVDLQKLDVVIHKYVPAGMSVHNPSDVNYSKGLIPKFDLLNQLYCYRELKDTKRIERSIGTLGGGNHFVEINTDNVNNLYLVIHSGSRNLGKQVAEYYQNIAIDLCSGKGDYYDKRKQLIIDYKQQGKRDSIQKALKELEKKYNHMLPSYPKDLCFLTGDFRQEYLRDMEICQEYAKLNRETMASIILDKWLNKNLHHFEYFHTIHNYINFNDNIIRKGAISAYEGEKVIIPMNMRDGSLLCIGKGNPDWNYSAPHGAGRLMSRSKAKENIKLADFEFEMQDVYSTTVNQSTLDEAPMAYKPMEEIMENIKDTVDVLKVIKPIYNFKSSDSGVFKKQK